eukprot:COSAG05_NODE_131_length_17136_cov_213.547279_4_plen_1156_part_00
MPPNPQHDVRERVQDFVAVDLARRELPGRVDVSVTRSKRARVEGAKGVAVKASANVEAGGDHVVGFGDSVRDAAASDVLACDSHGCDIDNGRAYDFERDGFSVTSVFRGDDPFVNTMLGKPSDMRACHAAVCARLLSEAQTPAGQRGVRNRGSGKMYGVYPVSFLDEVATLAVTLTSLDARGDDGAARFAVANRLRVMGLLEDCAEELIDECCSKFVTACNSARAVNGVAVLTSDGDGGDAICVKGARVRVYVADRVHMSTLRTSAPLGCKITQLAREHPVVYVCLRQLWSIDSSVVLQRVSNGYRVYQAFRYDVDNGVFSASAVSVKLQRSLWMQSSDQIEKAMGAYFTEVVNQRASCRRVGGVFDLGRLGRLQDSCREAERGSYGLFSAVVAMILNANDTDESATRAYSKWLSFLSSAMGSANGSVSLFTPLADGGKETAVVAAARAMREWVRDHLRRVNRMPFGAAEKKSKFICRAASVPVVHWDELHRMLMGMSGIGCTEPNCGVYLAELPNHVLGLCAALRDRLGLSGQGLGWDSKSLQVILLEVYRVVCVPMDSLAYRAVLRQFGPKVVEKAMVLSATGAEVQLHHMPSQSLRSANDSREVDLGRIVHASLSHVAPRHALEVADALRRAEQSVRVGVDQARYLRRGSSVTSQPHGFAGRTSQQIEQTMHDYAISCGVEAENVDFGPMYEHIQIDHPNEEGKRPGGNAWAAMGSDEPVGDGSLAQYVVDHVNNMLELQGVAELSDEDLDASAADPGADQGCIPRPVGTPGDWQPVGTIGVGLVVGECKTLRNLSVEAVQIELGGDLPSGVWFGSSSNGVVPDVVYVFTPVVVAVKATRREGKEFGWEYERRGGWLRTGTVPFPAYTGVSNFQYAEHVVEEVRERELVMAYYAEAQKATTAIRIDLYAVGVASKKLQRNADQPLCRQEWSATGQLYPLSGDTWQRVGLRPASLLTRLRADVVKWLSPDRWRFDDVREWVPAVCSFICAICTERVFVTAVSRSCRRTLASGFTRMSATFRGRVVAVVADRPPCKRLAGRTPAKPTGRQAARPCVVLQPDVMVESKVVAPLGRFETACRHEYCTDCVYPHAVERVRCGSTRYDRSYPCPICRAKCCAAVLEDRALEIVGVEAAEAAATRESEEALESSEKRRR